MRHLSDLANNIVVLMNLDPTTPLSSKDVRNPPGSGPQWYLPDGSVDPNVMEAAGYCDEAAATLLQIRTELAAVNFPSVDKQHLLATLAADAASWTARGAAWRTKGPVKDAQATATAITKHLTAAFDAAKHVQQYLKPQKELG